MRVSPLVLVALTLLAGCSTPASRGAFQLAAMPAANTPAEWVQKGDELEQFIYRNTHPYRSRLGEARDALLKSGVTTTAIGALGGTVTGAISNNGTAKWVGVSVAGLNTVVGLWSALHGVDNAVAGCIKSLDDATADWDVADKSDEPKAQAAYAKLRNAFRDQANACPELGDQFSRLPAAQVF